MKTILPKPDKLLNQSHTATKRNETKTKTQASWIRTQAHNL